VDSTVVSSTGRCSVGVACEAWSAEAGVCLGVVATDSLSGFDDGVEACTGIGGAEGETRSILQAAGRVLRIAEVRVGPGRKEVSRC